MGFALVLLIVLNPGLALCGLEKDPLDTLDSGVPERLCPEPDLLGDLVSGCGLRVFLLPNRIETPAAATLYCHTVHEAIEERDEGALVADHSEHEACNDVVMEMELVAFRPKTFRIPVGEAKNGSDEYQVLFKAS